MRGFLVSLLASLVLTVAFGQGRNPCHSNKSGQGANVTCEKVVLPNNLCKKCKLKPFDPFNGNFLNCRSIYDLEDVGCRTALREYAELNKECDPVRLSQVENFTPQDIEGLDYFVYSICEECCDCVPFGSDPDDYDGAKADGRLLVPDRGNCPAHAWYDICQIWPQVRFVSRPGRSDPARLPPIICPILTTWIHSPDATNWLGMETVNMPKAAKSFLNRFLNVAKCKNREIWETCARLESAQKRLG